MNSMAWIITWTIMWVSKCFESWPHVPSNICLLCGITQASRCLVCRLQCHMCYAHALGSVTIRSEQQQRTAEHMHTLKMKPHQLGAAVLVCQLLLLQTEPDCFLQVLHLQVLFHTLTHHLLNKHSLYWPCSWLHEVSTDLWVICTTSRQ